MKLRRKLKVLIHCSLKTHRRGVVHHSNHDGSQRWTTWVCADCAESLPINRHLTANAIAWAKRVIEENPGIDKQ